MKTKICTKCKIPQSIDSFYRKKGYKDGIRSTCIKCTLLEQSIYRIKNLEKIKEDLRNHYNQNKLKYKDRFQKYKTTNEYKLRRKKQVVAKYGLSIEEYEQLLKNCNYSCSICNRSLDTTLLKEKSITTPVIDHDHKTNKVRNILCYKCNSVIGYANDDIDILKKAIKYLRKYK